MSSKKNLPTLPVEIKGTLQVPVDLSILETLRTEMMGEGLHDQIVEEALRMGVASCLAGFDKIKLKRELKPPSSSSSSSKEQEKKNKKNNKKSSSAASRSEQLEQEAEKMKETTSKKNQDGFASTTTTTAPEEEKESENNNHLVSRFSNQRFIASVDFPGLQTSIDRLLNAYDSMATKIDDCVNNENGAFVKLMKMKDSLPKEAQELLSELDSSLTKAIEPPAVPEGVPPKSRFDDDEDSDDDSQEDDGNTKNKNRVTGTVVVETEEEYSAKYAKRGLLAGSDDDEEGEEEEDDDDDWKNKDPAAMGYAPLTDD